MIFFTNNKMFQSVSLIVCLLFSLTFALPQNYHQLAEYQTHLSRQKDKLIENVGKSVEGAQEAKLRAAAATLRTYGREEARKETETKLSQLDSYYANLQKKTNDYLNRKPIVDTISEHEKYGNDGGINRAASIAFVNVYENIANKINAIFEVPSNAVQGVKLQAGEVLRYFGRNLVGL